LPQPRPGPDRSAALAQYRHRAARYDLELAPFEPVRQRAIECLGLGPGQHVLDVGCGTGLSFAPLRRAVGPAGGVVGIEQSPDMLALARERVARERWANVSLVCAPTEEAGIHGQADAALFHFTHDILRRPEAIDRVLASLRPGATVVAAGLKWAEGWAWPTNLFVWSAALYSVTSLEGLAAPWSLLAQRVEGLTVETALFGAAYVACGRVGG
jgi:SAM-dependent methyltransferase